MFSLRRFDVSLRDGLQSMNNLFSFNEKKQMLNKIIRIHRPERMEVGSLVSEKVLPQMKDSFILYNYAQTKYSFLYNKREAHDKKDRLKKCEFYLLVPPTLKYLEQAKTYGISNISLTTSVSDAFQQKNIRQSIHQTKNILCDFFGKNKPPIFNNIKLYISCITECPIVGKQCNNIIINEILHYSRIPQMNELCLSDTCGTMQFNDFKYILDNLLGYSKVDISKLSLHLHVNHANIDNITKIIRYAVKNKLYNFDVTSLENVGGCSVTMDKTNMHGNLTYNQLYNTLLFELGIKKII